MQKEIDLRAVSLVQQARYLKLKQQAAASQGAAPKDEPTPQAQHALMNQAAGAKGEELNGSNHSSEETYVSTHGTGLFEFD